MEKYNKVLSKMRSSRPEVFLEKVVQKKCSKFTGENSYQSVVSIKLQSSVVEITLRHVCAPVNLLNILRTTLDGCFCKMYKHLFQQKLQQKVQQSVQQKMHNNHVALFIK